MPDDLQHTLGRIEGKLDAHAAILLKLSEREDRLEERVRSVETDVAQSKTVALTAATFISIIIALVGNAADWFANFFGKH